MGEIVEPLGHQQFHGYRTDIILFNAQSTTKVISGRQDVRVPMDIYNLNNIIGPDNRSELEMITYDSRIPHSMTVW